MEKTKKNDFIELKFTGYANDQIFDSNIEEDLKSINPEAKPQKTIVVIGQKMVVRGLDKALEDKEINKEYVVDVPFKEGFGERKRELMKTLPLKSFTDQKVNPQAGMVLSLDQHLVKIIAVSGARVTTDFNNPLAGKDLRYKYKIVRKIEDKKEKSETLFSLFFRFVPEFEIKEGKVVVKGPKAMGPAIDHYKEKFKELIKLDLEFEEKKEEEKKPEDKQETENTEKNIKKDELEKG